MICSIVHVVPTSCLPRVVQGSDGLAQAILDAHELPGDKFYLFAMRNVFALSGALRDAVEADLVRLTVGSLARC